MRCGQGSCASTATRMNGGTRLAVGSRGAQQQGYTIIPPVHMEAQRRRGAACAQGRSSAHGGTCSTKLKSGRRGGCVNGPCHDRCSRTHKYTNGVANNRDPRASSKPGGAAQGRPTQLTLDVGRRARAPKRTRPSSRVYMRRTVLHVANEQRLHAAVRAAGERVRQRRVRQLPPPPVYVAQPRPRAWVL